MPLNSQIASILLRSGTRLALALPGDRCTFRGSQTLQSLHFTCIPLFPVSDFCDLCLRRSSSSLHSSVTPTYLPTRFLSCPAITCETERNLYPVAGPPLMFLEGSAALQACTLIPLRYQPWQLMDGAVLPLYVMLAQGNQSSIYQLWQYASYERGAFSLSHPHGPVSLFHVQTKISHTLCADTWFN